MDEETKPDYEPLIRSYHLAGDYTRAATLVLEHLGPPIQRFIRLRVNQREVADEAFSQFCHDLWRGLPSFRWNCPVRVWAYTLARHAMQRSSKRARRHQQQRVSLSRVGVLSRLAHRTRTRTRPEFRTESRDRIAALLRRLPEEDQLLLSLRLTRRLDWKEIAQLVGEPSIASGRSIDQESARLRKRLQLIKRKLRHLLEEEALSNSSATGTTVS